MDHILIDYFIISNKDKFIASDLENIRVSMANMSEEQCLNISKIDFTSPDLMLAVSIILGFLGVDRMALGEFGLGFLKLITCGGCGIWWLVDLFIIMRKTKEFNYRKFLQNIV
jgi:TM2 domain-containing membrane protein YozV